MFFKKLCSFVGFLVFFILVSEGDLCAARAHRRQQAGLFREGAFYPYFARWLQDLKVAPYSYESMADFRAFFISAVFKKFPEFALIGRSHTTLADIFAHARGSSDMLKVKNCLEEQSKTLQGNVAAMIAYHCDAKWKAAHPDDVSREYYFE